MLLLSVMYLLCHQQRTASPQHLRTVMFDGRSERWIMSGLHGSHPIVACALFEGFFSKPSLKSRNTIFTLGQRGAILSPAELEGPILVPHTAQRGDSRVGSACLTLTEQQKHEPQGGAATNNGDL